MKHWFVPILSICLLASTGLGGCKPIVETRGHVEDKDETATIKPGMSRDEVQSVLGSPSSVSSFGPETWYYMSARKEHVGFMKPKITEQQVTQIEFDSAGMVASVENYDKSASRKIKMVSRTTPTEGHSLGFFEQILGNVGRFNKQKEEAK